MPAALSLAADASLRARAVSSCPAARSRSATALPIYPVAPVRKIFILAYPQVRGLSTLTESYHAVRVRHAEPADARRWADLRHALWPDQSREELEAEAKAFLRGAEPRLHAVLLAVEPDGSLVGFAELSLRPYAEDCVTTPVAFL